MDTAQRFTVMHALRVKGLASLDDVAATTGLAGAGLVATLHDLVADELAKLRTGRVSGYALTAAGRAEHARLVGRNVTPDEQAALAAAYEGFLSANGRFKEICTRWQLRPGPDGVQVPNDHSDASYDAGVVHDLASLHEEAVEVVAPAVEGYPRFGLYPARFGAALARVRHGDVAAFARPMSASYHDVWMELHEDFLLLLRRERDVADGH